MTSESSNRDRLVLLAKCLGIVACLYLFIVGVGGMGESFKLFGKSWRSSPMKSPNARWRWVALRWEQLRALRSIPDS